MRALYGVVCGVVLAMAAGCNSGFHEPASQLSGRLTGTWLARASGHTGDAFVLRLEQSGLTITGTACEADGGVTLFRDAPVHGQYPDVGFTVTQDSAAACCPQLVGTRFSGRQDGTGDIVGQIEGRFDLRFQRLAGAIGC
jgi:hypothetical protein